MTVIIEVIDYQMEVLLQNEVHSNLLIVSVKVTLWDPNINDCVNFDYEILQDKEYEHT